MKLSIEGLKNEGYKYMFIPKKSKKKFYVTKANLKKDGMFRDSTVFYEYIAESKYEEEVLKILPKGELIRI